MKITKPIIILSALSVYVAVSGLVQPTRMRYTDELALLIYSVCLVLCLHFIVDGKDEAIKIDLSRPMSLFSLFFMVFYVLLNWLSIVLDAPGRNNSLLIAAMTITAFLSAMAGLWLSGYRRTDTGFKLSERDASILYAGAKWYIPFLVWYYAWKIKEGTFYAHAGYFEQPHTVFASIMQSVIGPLQIPLFLILGLIARSVDENRANAVRRFLICYMVLSAAVYTLASQFLPTAAAIVFTIASLNISRTKPVKLRTYVVIGCACVAMYAVIMAVRAVSLTQGGFKDSGNQLSASAAAITSSPSDESAVAKGTRTRALTQVNLLSALIDRINQGHPYLHGELLASVAYSLIPRVIWPSKPTVTPMQILLRINFDMPPEDDSPGPIVEAYANGGWPIVCIAFLLIGLTSGWLTKRVGLKTTIINMVVLACWWYVLADMEQEVVLAVLARARLAFCIAFGVWLFRGTIPRRMVYMGKVAGAACCLPFLWLAAPFTPTPGAQKGTGPQT